MKILLLEDDLDLCDLIQKELSKSGHTVDCCNDGETAMLYALNKDYGYDLALVDRMLPIIDGLTIIKAMRRKDIQIPVIIITGMSALDDRIDGLDGGADDYLVKPFHIRELLARIRALTRRSKEIHDDVILTYGDLQFDREIRELTCHEQKLGPDRKRGGASVYIMKQPETLFTKEQLVLKVWGTDSDITPGNIDNYISFLRKRLKRALKAPVSLKRYMLQATDWRTHMLKQLSNRLYLFLAGILMVIITLILCFSLWNMYQSQQLADISYIQRMTSLIIYQLEDDTSNPQAVLSNYESGTNVYSIFRRF